MQKFLNSNAHWSIVVACENISSKRKIQNPLKNIIQGQIKAVEI